MGAYAKGFINRGNVSCEGLLGDFLGKIFKTHSEFTDPDIKLWKRASQASKFIQATNYTGEISFSTKKLIINPALDNVNNWLKDGDVVGGWVKNVLEQTEKLFNLLHDIEQNGWDGDHNRDQELAKFNVEPFNTGDVVKVFKEIKLPHNPFTDAKLKSGLTIHGFSNTPPYCKIEIPDTTVTSVSLTAVDLKALCTKLKSIADKFYTGNDGYSANGQHQKILEYTDTEKMILRLKNAKFKPDDDRTVRDSLITICRELGIACHIDNVVGAKLDTSISEFLCAVADTIKE